MKFIALWLIASFVTFYTRFSAVVVLDVKFFLGVFFIGLLWTIGISVVLFVILCIIGVIGAIMEDNR